MRVIPFSSLSKHPMPIIILIKGQPGSGKSTLSKALATKLQWPLIDKDDARDTLQLVAPTAPQLLDWNSLSYELFFNFAHAQLKCGLNIILDCPFARQSLYDRVKLFADQV
jgi:predicted kinase